MKLNPEYALFDGNMFVQMRGLLADIDLPAGIDMLDMSIGEPQITGGDLLTSSVINHNDAWQYYPKVLGIILPLSLIHISEPTRPY